jgi:hypothetical protein
VTPCLAAQGNIEAFGGKRIADGFNKAISFREQRRPIAWCSCSSQIWTRSRRSRRNSRSFGRTLGYDKYASYRVIVIEGIE